MKDTTPFKRHLKETKENVFSLEEIEGNDLLKQKLDEAIERGVEFYRVGNDNDFIDNYDSTASCEINKISFDNDGNVLGIYLK